MRLKKSRAKRALIALTVLGSVALLSGCGMVPVPEEERFVNIDQYLDTIDYTSAGIITKETKTGDGFVAASVKNIWFEDEATYEVLLPRILAVDGADCSNNSPGYLRCNVGPSLSLSLDASSDPSVTLMTINDTISGRKR